MSVRLLLEELYHGPNRPWRFSRSLFLLMGIGALGYSGWIYVDEYIHDRAESKAFDRARESLTRANPVPRAEGVPPPPAEPFRAKLVIARLHLTTMVDEGVGEDTLRYAAGHIPGTALPDQLGNVCVAAHRDTLFRKLKDIRKHDRIVLSTLTKDYDYEVTATAIVRPNDVSVLAATHGKKTLTLVTCYPFYFIGAAPKRFIVQARQIAETSASATDD
jgi:sortase A